MIPVLTLVTTGLVGLVCLFLPIGLLVGLRKKYKAGILTFFIGCSVYVLFALVLEQYCHVLVLGLTGIADNVVLSALYGGFAAALFEESGRFVAFRFFMKGRQNLGEALMYGAGHGGIEAFILMGVNMLYYTVLGVMFNRNPAMFDGWTDASSYTGWAQQMQTTGAGAFAWGGVERVLALVLQLCLSVLVMTAVVCHKPGWIFVSGGLHMLVNCVAVLTLQYTQSAALTELVLAAMAAGSVVLTLQAARRLRAAEKTGGEPRPDDPNTLVLHPRLPRRPM